MSLSASDGMNDYFLYNDIRNGETTIHSWDLADTTEKQKAICLLLLKNRRKKAYGCLDGNPLSLDHFVALDRSITQNDIENLVTLGILAKEQYAYTISSVRGQLTDVEAEILSYAKGRRIVADELKVSQSLKIQKFDVGKAITSLVSRGVLTCCEYRYDFKNSKISTGLNGINRVFLPSSSVFPTLVASDTNDMVATKDISAESSEELRKVYLSEIHQKGNFRKITKAEACLLQGFPENYILPESRARWMKLIGNSVAVPVIKLLSQSVIETGILENTYTSEIEDHKKLAI